MFFHLGPTRAVLSDTLAPLVATYKVVQKQVEPLVSRLEQLAELHDRDHFYALREKFNTETRASELERAARLIYLNKTCFNGLFRTNASGAFNVPFGAYKNPKICDSVRLRLASAMLSRATIHRAPFGKLAQDAKPGDFIYLDPPYVPLSKTSSFSAYADGGFDLHQHENLAQLFRKLSARGCLLAMSNSDTPEVRKLYKGFDILPIRAPRAIGARARSRGHVQELLIRNVALYPR